jgi:hypothetical protein
VFIALTPGARDKDFKTPLHLAAEHGHLKCVEELAEVSDVNAQDYNLNTPLHLAATNGHISCMDLMNNADVSLTNRNFKTAKEILVEHQIRNWEIGKADNLTIGDHIVKRLNLKNITVIKGKETLGDGNCFYRAIADILKSDHVLLRQAIVQRVLKEYNLLSRSPELEIMIHSYESEHGDNSFRDMIEEQKKNGVFANETFIAYTADDLGIAILVFKIENEGSVREVLFPSKLMTESEVDKTRQICIAHYNEHFQGVVLVRSNDERAAN